MPPRTAESEFPWLLIQKSGCCGTWARNGRPSREKGPVLQWVAGSRGSEAELSRGEESAGQREPGEGRRLCFRTREGRRPPQGCPGGLQPRPLEIPLGTPSQQHQTLLLAPDPPRAAPAGGGSQPLLPPQQGWLAVGSQASSCCFRAGAASALCRRGSRDPVGSALVPRGFPTPGPTHSSAQAPIVWTGLRVTESTLYWDAGSLPGPYTLRLGGTRDALPTVASRHGRPGSLPPDLTPPGPGTLPASPGRPLWPSRDRAPRGCLPVFYKERFPWTS